MMLQRVFVFLLMNIIQTTAAKEPWRPACSRYDYEERLLERVIRNELSMETLLKEIHETNVKIESSLKILERAIYEVETQLKSEINKAKAYMSDAVAEMTNNSSMTAIQIKKEIEKLKGFY
ncbi:hypothetical protein DPMN_138190 [Dreissena polymorpha]|uniref:Uncharacterized protein n=1 Tax=Dreissena polymorpha TaxID=45954 RepID=A0A9D4JFD8_DREPO|nr:hypothetical protein DPMN_138190 [Dreissena polymorpha]